MLEVLSVIRGIGWPAVPSPRAAQLLALQLQLEASQWLPPEELQRRQQSQLCRVLAHAFDSVPYYRDQLNAVEFSPAANWSPEQWQRIPILTRERVQAVGATLHSASLPVEHGTATPIYTSGSTGRPVMALSTGVTKAFWNAFTLRDHLWHQRDFRGKLAVIRSFADSPSGEPSSPKMAAQWGSATAELVQTGSCAMMSIHATVDQQAEWLVQQDPEYLLTYPSNAAALARVFRATNARLPRLREVRTFGEILEPHVPALCQATWGAKVVDNYSSQEFGYLALQCPETPRYHVQSENVLVEVLDDHGQPCEPGQVGRLIITTLHNFAMPLIRYEIGDYAVPGPPCACGRSLPVLERILGRQRNMALLPDGRRFWPSVELVGSDDLSSLPPIQQFQLIQRTLYDMDLLLVTPRRLTTGEESTVRSWVERATLGSFRIGLQYVDRIDRSHSGKFEDFRCEVGESSLANKDRR